MNKFRTFKSGFCLAANDKTFTIGFSLCCIAIVAGIFMKYSSITTTLLIATMFIALGLEAGNIGIEMIFNGDKRTQKIKDVKDIFAFMPALGFVAFVIIWLQELGSVIIVRLGL